MRSKPKCEIKSHRACNGQCIRRYTGFKKDDPKFYCCIGCLSDLQRAGIEVKRVIYVKK